MGASGSKQATKAVRKFPTRAPGAAPPPTISPATGRPPQTPSPQAAAQAAAQAQTSFAKDNATRQQQNPDPRAIPEQDEDPTISPDFASRLQKMGIVQPNPILSNSSIANSNRSLGGTGEVIPKPQEFSAPKFPAAVSNVTLGALEARRQLEQRANEEFDNTGRPGYQGREFLDVATIRNILVMRQRGDSPADIEARLRLKPGVVSRLGRSGIVSPAT